MKTKIYKSYREFMDREDKTENGVSADFAENNPNFEEQNKSNESCWNCSRCYDCSRCSRCSGCSGCSGCSDCSGCSGCSGCYDCYDCSDCSGCSGCSRCSRCSRCYGCSRCSRCSGCSGCSNVENSSPVSGDDKGIKIPVVENIHSKVLEAVTKEGSLEMSSWHKESACGMTHCRGGWVVTLAGPEGKKLEEQTSSEFAAMAIYSKSSDIRVSPVRFYEDNEKAMADIKRCAQIEKEAQ